MLHAKNKKSFEPMAMLANWGSGFPTHQKHDLKGLAAWGDRLVISVAKSEVK